MVGHRGTTHTMGCREGVNPGEKGPNRDVAVFLGLNTYHR